VDVKTILAIAGLLLISCAVVLAAYKLGRKAEFSAISDILTERNNGYAELAYKESAKAWEFKEQLLANRRPPEHGYGSVAGFKVLFAGDTSAEWIFPVKYKSEPLVSATPNMELGATKPSIQITKDSAVITIPTPLPWSISFTMLATDTEGSAIEFHDANIERITEGGIQVKRPVK